MDEYKHIQDLRKMWSGFIIDWLRIIIPVGAAFDGFFSYLSLAQARDLSYSWVFPLVGWLIFVIPLILWRFVVNYIDRQIVGMYPRMLELEQQMQPEKWQTHAMYYFNNLKQQAKELLVVRILGLPRHRTHDLCYRQYRQICVARDENLHQLLLTVWDVYGYNSVISRGHRIQDVAVGFICFVTFSIAGIFSWGINHSQGWEPFTIAIAVSGVLGVLFALIAAHCLVNR